MNKGWFTLVIVLAMAISAFFHTQDLITPDLSYTISDTTLRSKPSPFAALSAEESKALWATEYQIAKGFSKELNLYQTIVSYERAAILAKDAAASRTLEMNYTILYCYFLAKKYKEVTHLFENSALKEVSSSFAPYHDLLVILYESYLKTHQDKVAASILQMIQNQYQSTYQKLLIWKAFCDANPHFLQQMAASNPYLQQFLDAYLLEKKSPLTAELLNTVIPGAGYFYLGQYQSAVTSFFLNGLFLGASVRFFINKSIAAGLIAASFESGWYYGGILGSGLEANQYNSIIYRKMALPLMVYQGLFPVLMLQYGL